MNQVERVFVFVCVYNVVNIFVDASQDDINDTNSGIFAMRAKCL